MPRRRALSQDAVESDKRVIVKQVFAKHQKAVQKLGAPLHKDATPPLTNAPTLRAHKIKTAPTRASLSSVPPLKFAKRGVVLEVFRAHKIRCVKSNLLVIQPGFAVISANKIKIVPTDRFASNRTVPPRRVANLNPRVLIPTTAEPMKYATIHVVSNQPVSPTTTAPDSATVTPSQGRVSSLPV